jgi:ligand-binding SRPBCC domain-containing protein
MPAGAYVLRTWLWLPAPRERVFPFFADARNLERITPAFLRFRVLNTRPIVMTRGTVIDYRLRLRGLPLRWRSAITEWDPPVRFCDAQIRGPYAEWVHTHVFEPQDRGTMVRDEVRYRLAGPSILTRPAHARIVAPDLRRIFEFRHAALTAIFSAAGTARAGPVGISRASCHPPIRNQA